MAIAKKELLNATETWMGSLTSRLYELDNGSDEEKLYSVIPVDVETFVSSSDYLGVTKWEGRDTVLSVEQREYLEAATDFENGITDFSIWVGKGGGKNFVSIVTFAYLSYKMLCMRNVHKYFKRDPLKAITLLNVAVNSTQAKANFFDPLSQVIRTAGPKAFRDFGFNPEKDILATEITFPKNIVLRSGHSKAGGRSNLFMPLA